MVEVTREGDRALRFDELGGKVEDRVLKVADKVDSVYVKERNDDVLRLEFGTSDGTEKMMQMIGTLV